MFESINLPIFAVDKLKQKRMEDLKVAPEVEKEEQEPVIKDLREDILIAACEYAYRVRGTRHMLTHEQVKEQIYKEMGWS